MTYFVDALFDLDSYLEGQMVSAHSLDQPDDVVYPVNPATAEPVAGADEVGTTATADEEHVVPVTDTVVKVDGVMATEAADVIG